ncbi:MAG TPA: hypothetical protein VD993_10610 [Chitinophagaceae bacterium]|nr:hypothetical protein [Chitinophagaceae bacterium]
MKRLSVLALAGLIALQVSAQQHHQHTDTSRLKEQSAPSDGEGMLMSHAYSLNLPMSRNSSGTAWQPDISPMYMYMRGNARHNWMIHGNVFLRYNNQDVFNKGSRGASKVDAPNWFMGMYNRRIGSAGLFNATAMISFDPLTVRQSGYPLLFQSGETYNGEKLVDRQHPHDLFSGLSVAYTHMLSKDVDVTIYAGYPGEPALGPAAFMHRISSINNPNAPLGHHWQDATHITYGVGTLGFRYKKLKLEGSLFSGREPDENRYNFESAAFDSYSYRILLNPTPHWAFQFSQGFLNEPERLEPGIDQVRTTVSIMNSASMRTMNWTHTLVWGMNDKTLHEANENSVLYETNLQFLRQALYARYEFIKKSAEDLAITSSHDGQLYTINAFTLGYNHNISPAAPLDVLLGVQATLNFPPSALKAVYGSVPVGAQVYLQLRPRRHQHF